MSRIGGILAVLAIALAITGCKKDENPASNNNNNNQTSTYVGTIANATESGSISLTVSLAKGMGGVTGTLKLVSPSAATINLSGTFINNVLSVSGGNYSFAGTLANGTISGTYGGPNGGGGVHYIAFNKQFRESLCRDVC